MSVIGIVGSPRSGGNSETLVDAVLAGAKANGKDVKKYNLNKMNIRGCQACMGCKKTGVCVQKDDLTQVFEELKKAEAVVLGTPTYFGQPSAQFRIFQDRCYSLIDLDSKSFVEPGKKLVTVVSCASGAENAKSMADGLEGTYAGMLKMVPSGKLMLAGGGPPNVAAGNKDIMAEADAIGKKL